MNEFALKLILLALVKVAIPTPVPQATETPTPAPIHSPVVVPLPTKSKASQCAPLAQTVSSDTARFGDGKGGTLFKISETNPNNYAFLLPGNIPIYDFVEICTDKNCQKLPFAGCANPDHIGERAHYKGPITLRKHKEWTAKFGTSRLKIGNKQRQD